MDARLGEWVLGLQPGHVRHSVGPGVAGLHHPITDHGTGHSDFRGAVTLLYIYIYYYYIYIMYI